MKKALALVLAVAMIASMAVASFAATQVYNKTYGTDKAVNVYTDNFWKYDAKATNKYIGVANGSDTTFGTTLYLLFANGEAMADPNVNLNGFVTDSDAVKGLNVTAKWDKNGEYIKSVEIVKVGKAYAIAFATTGSSLEPVEVLGEVSVKGKTYFEDAQGKNQKEDYTKQKFNVEIDLAWAAANAVDGMDVTTKTVYDFEAVPTADEEDFAMTFGPFAVKTDVKNMKKVLMACDQKDNEELLDAYVDADLVFVNCVASFRRTAEVTVDLAEGEYLYEIVDGKLVAVEGEYDDWTEELTFKTRKLGNYVISDTELVVEEVVAANPSTGAAA